MGFLRELKVASVCKWNDELPRLPRSLLLKDALRIIADYEETCFPVVDDNDQLIGLLSHDSLLKIEPGFMGRVLVVEDVRANLVTVTPNEDIRSALDKLVVSGYKEILVVDEGNRNKVLGTLSQMDLMTANDDGRIRKKSTER